MNPTKFLRLADTLSACFKISDCFEILYKKNKWREKCQTRECHEEDKKINAQVNQSSVEKKKEEMLKDRFVNCSAVNSVVIFKTKRTFLAQSFVLSCVYVTRLSENSQTDLLTYCVKLSCYNIKQVMVKLHFKY